MIFSRFRWNSSQYLELRNASSAYVYYRKTRLNLLTGWRETYSIRDFIALLDKENLQDKVRHPKVYHFHYEFGLILQGLGHTVGEEVPLAIEIIYESKSFKAYPNKSKIAKIDLRSIERPSWTEYKLAFARIQEYLLEGHAYQVNLTYPFDFETEEVLDPRDIVEFFFSRNGLGAYAHATFMGDELVLSNSPECLFQFQKNEIFTMPIKGTLKRKGTFKQDWKKLSSDPKEEGELIMITDLLKNDLNRLDQPKAKVVKLKSPLKVPGLLHQFSLLKLTLEKNVSFLRTLECLFPGGSITGAPKKRVMEILQDVERYPRGIYTGSTILCIDDKKIASINIRTAQISITDRLWRYAAGGGVTLLSRPVFEFQEMEDKVSSFLTLLKAPGYSKK